MSVRLDVNVTGAQLAGRLLGRTGEHLQDPRPAFRSIADYLRSVEREQFATQGGARSGGWERNRPGTVRQKGSGRVLVASGALMRSLTGKGGGSRARATRYQLIFGTTRFYARFVARRRPFLRLNRQDRRHIKSLLRRYVRSGAL